MESVWSWFVYNPFRGDQPGRELYLSEQIRVGSIAERSLVLVRECHHLYSANVISGFLTLLNAGYVPKVKDSSVNTMGPEQDTKTPESIALVRTV
jgi:hypothetical protein